MSVILSADFLYGPPRCGKYGRETRILSGKLTANCITQCPWNNAITENTAICETFPRGIHYTVTETPTVGITALHACLPISCPRTVSRSFGEYHPPLQENLWLSYYSMRLIEQILPMESLGNKSVRMSFSQEESPYVINLVTMFRPARLISMVASTMDIAYWH